MSLPDGDLVLHGRIMPASNATFLAEIGDLRVVYKPIRGERPLWDFPDGTLANRERAAYLVSEATGWGVVPETVLRDGPHGPGMVQRWCEPVDPQASASGPGTGTGSSAGSGGSSGTAVDVVPAGQVPPGWREVFEGVDEHDRPVALVHEDSEPLRRMAVLDVLINNADRKGGHVLAMADGHRYGVDHGVSFHVEPKLRTVLWGWLGEPLSGPELDGVRRVLDDRELVGRLEDLLAVAEVEALLRRARELVAEGAFPQPSGGWPSIPWPPF